jgi:cytochrome c oxidase cbb3-type subunit 3
MRTLRSRSLGTTGAVVAALVVAACSGGQQGTTTTSAGGTTVDTSGGTVRESPSSNKNPAVTATEVTHEFNGNIQEANAGRTLFLTKNCVGCHGGLAGGAMGPSLRDTVWKYGGTDQAIAASIRDGRPAGMPAWGRANVVGQENTLTDDEIQKIITYIRSIRTEAEPTFFFWDQRQQAGTEGTGTP